MKKLLIIFVMHLILACTVAGAIDTVEPPKSCNQCGMDRLVYARSRMLIAYSDGTTVGVCSLHCAAAELRDSLNKQVKSIMVADYSTKKLLDAKTAVWVVGGKKKGVMTSLAKWAFASVEDARRFREENGGEMNTFDQAMNAATLEVMDQAAEERAVEDEFLREMK